MEPPGSWPRQEKTMSLLLKSEDGDILPETSNSTHDENEGDIQLENENGNIPDSDLEAHPKQSSAANLPIEIIEQYVFRHHSRHFVSYKLNECYS